MLVEKVESCGSCGVLAWFLNQINKAAAISYPTERKSSETGLFAMIRGAVPLSLGFVTSVTAPTFS